MNPDNRLDTVLPWLAAATLGLFVALIAAKMSIAVPTPSVASAEAVPPAPASAP